MTAVEIHTQLEELESERALALLEGFSVDSVYMADLRQDIVATRSAYVGMAVLEIAALRADLSGPRFG